jgi:hypothetical protein
MYANCNHWVKTASTKDEQYDTLYSDVTMNVVQSLQFLQAWSKPYFLMIIEATLIQKITLHLDCFVFINYDGIISNFISISVFETK